MEKKNSTVVNDDADVCFRLNYKEVQVKCSCRTNLLQCHYSYSACGLGTEGTDRLVGLVQEKQHSKPSKSEDRTLYGAKITGGGSGGTVCVIGRNSLKSSQQIFEVSPFDIRLFLSLSLSISLSLV